MDVLTQIRITVINSVLHLEEAIKLIAKNLLLFLTHLSRFKKNNLWEIFFFFWYFLKPQQKSVMLHFYLFLKQVFCCFEQNNKCLCNAKFTYNIIYVYYIVIYYIYHLQKWFFSFWMFGRIPSLQAPPVAQR